MSAVPPESPWHPAVHIEDIGYFAVVAWLLDRTGQYPLRELLYQKARYDGLVLTCYWDPAAEEYFWGPWNTINGIRATPLQRIARRLGSPFPHPPKPAVHADMQAWLKVTRSYIL
eukprot:4467287-Pleurochrysis_carterae.AAC.1